MMKPNEHLDVLEVLGMCASKVTICNKLNKVHVRTQDFELRSLISKLINEIQTTSNNTRVMAPKNMKNGVPSASKAISYCESNLFEREVDQMEEGSVTIEFNGKIVTVTYTVNEDTLEVYLPDGSSRSTELRGLSPESAAKTHLKVYAAKNT
ncbi:hypothetical protein [Vibrio aestuarianus]|uniref:Uncharacterized protein n=1 Tax=Vibrio aestuarianus TaxID=28171 RepID=A0A9X4IYN3_9VIBR|nr:hypothetical protein [Vibrio aestuarianus]MDE1348374.1 hypothetical protein [Vibrio aestuarianus]